MKQLLKKLLSITALLSIGAVHANGVTPTLVFRSQGFHGDRQRNVGMVGKTCLPDQDSWYGTFDAAVGYMRSFRNDRLAHCLFGNDLDCSATCKNTILVQGSEVADRNEKAWLADYFYLSCEYDGSFSIAPRIQNVVADLDFYLGMDEWVQGMYFNLYGPINWTKWQTNFCVNNPDTAVTTSCSTGYFTPTGDEVLLDDLANYFQGSAPASINHITFQPLKYAKMPNCDRTQVGFAELRAELGWNFILNEDYHLGVGIHAAAPTGNRRHAEFVMNPTVGNGKHWELGGALHGHYILWRNENEDRHVGLYVDAVFTHLFNAREQRTFDLKDKDNSRYMLAMKFHTQVFNNLSGRPTAGTGSAGATKTTAVFNNLYTPVANLTTTDLNVSVGLQADITGMFNITLGNFSWDLGYNFWGRTCETIECDPPCNPCNNDSIFLNSNQNMWALKGDARMFGFAGSGNGPVDPDDPLALSATQSKATIHSGTNATTTNATLTNVALQNGGIDNPEFGVTGLVALPVRVIHTPLAEGGLNINANQINLSIQPIFIKKTDVERQETRGLSHTVFTHLSYNWDRENWNPFIGLGGSAEFGKTEGFSDECDEICNDCLDCSLSQWAVWIKGGVSFN